MMLSGRQRLLALTMAAIGGLAWWLQQVDEPEIADKTEKERRPDYTVDKFTAIEMGDTGEPAQRMTATELRHYADDDTNELESPELTIYEDLAPPWIVRSQSAWVSADRDEILLQGDVFIDRAAGETTRPLHLETRELRLKRRKKYAETDQPVQATSELDWVTSANGAKIWFGEDLRIELLGRARGEISMP